MGFDDDGWEDADWNFDDLDKKNEEDHGDVDIHSKEYQKRNLNKLSDAELAAEKRKMDKKFNENFLQPGDAGTRGADSGSSDCQIFRFDRDPLGGLHRGLAVHSCSVVADAGGGA